MGKKQENMKIGEPRLDPNNEMVNKSGDEAQEKVTGKPDKAFELHSGDIRLNIGGNVSNQVAIGNDVIQIGSVQGGVVNIGSQTEISGTGQEFASREEQPLEMNTRFSQLLNVLNDRFDISEIREICFVLNVDYENLLGETKRAKVHSLIEYHQRRDQISMLESEILRRRPGSLN